MDTKEARRTIREAFAADTVLKEGYVADMRRFIKATPGVEFIAPLHGDLVPFERQICEGLLELILGK